VSQLRRTLAGRQAISRMKGHEDGGNVLWTGGRVREQLYPPWSLERRWSSRRFPYGYLVTTSPQSLIPPWSAASLRLAHCLRVKPTPMVWRAVCTRPGNVFTAACWSAITSDSAFMLSSCREQSELRRLFGISYPSRGRNPLSPPL